VAIQTWQAGLEGTSAIPLRELVKQSLRMRPSRMMGYRERGNPDTGSRVPETSNVEELSSPPTSTKSALLPMLRGA
jgi:pilus assembly protein CpaF